MRTVLKRECGREKEKEIERVCVCASEEERETKRMLKTLQSILPGEAF